MALPFRSRFRRAIEDPSAPFSLDLDRDSTTLLIAFGGMRGQLGMPPFEFFRATRDMPVKRLFVRDLRQAWYHRGIPGNGANIEGVAESLRGLLAAHGAQRLVAAGNSAGGYAALLFGTLLGADTVLSFAPQTVLDSAVLAAWDDHRWDEQLGQLTGVGKLDARFADLRDALPEARCADTRYEVYFDDSFLVDRLHAERIADLEGVELIRLHGGKHGLVLEMRESGELARVLRRALGAGETELSGRSS